MVKISKEPAPGVSEEERKKGLVEIGYSLRRNKQTGEFCTVKKRPVEKTKRKVDGMVEKGE